MDEVLDNGNFKLRFLRTGRDTDGALLEVEATYGPWSKPPPRHHHPLQEERFKVTRGGLLFWVDGRTRVVSAGKEIVIPPGASHQASNAGSEPAVVIWQTRPALETEALFRAVHALGRRGNVLDLAMILRKHRQEIVLSRPGPVVQSCVFGMLAAVARLSGRP